MKNDDAPASPSNPGSLESRAQAELDRFDFALPRELIAVHPPARRGDSRLLRVPLDGGPVEHRQFRELSEFLQAGDVLVLNNTRVSPRRVFLRRPTGGRIEALFLEARPDGSWDCLLKNRRKLQPGELLAPEDPEAAGGAGDFVGTPAGAAGGVGVFVGTPTGDSGVLRFRFESGGDEGGRLRPLICRNSDTRPAWPDADAAEAFFHRYGQPPIPPYLGRAAEADDRTRYQTVYARRPGSVAAPTAGLHFTPELLSELRQRGIELAELELQIGYGTFAPLTEENLAAGRLHEERYVLDAATAERLNEVRGTPGARLIAVGTTSLRALEANLRLDMEKANLRLNTEKASSRRDLERLNPQSDMNQAAKAARFQAGTFSTELFLRPPDVIRSADGLITNFHLPRSSLLMLVACLIDRERLLASYAEAVREGYRFFSYGDAMLLL